MPNILTKSYLSVFLLILLLAVPVMAQDAAVGDLLQSLPAEEEAQKAPPAPRAGEELRELENYTAQLLRGLKPEEAQYIFRIRQEFGVIRSVQVARTDIEAAVTSCGDENPDLKNTMQERFEGWKAQIIPAIAVADTALKDAIQRQGFRPTVRVMTLLDHVQAAFEERDSQVKKVPVTTKEACENLLKSLDATEEELKNLLVETSKILGELTVTPPPSAEEEDNADVNAG